MSVTEASLKYLINIKNKDESDLILDLINWEDISCMTLSGEFIKEFKEYLNMEKVIEYNKLDTKTIIDCDLVKYMKALCKYQDLDEEFICNYAMYLDWDVASQYQKLPKYIIEEYKDYIKWDKLIINDKMKDMFNIENAIKISKNDNISISKNDTLEIDIDNLKYFKCIGKLIGYPYTKYDPICVIFNMSFINDLNTINEVVNKSIGTVIVIVHDIYLNEEYMETLMGYKTLLGITSKHNIYFNLHISHNKYTQLNDYINTNKESLDKLNIIINEVEKDHTVDLELKDKSLKIRF